MVFEIFGSDEGDIQVGLFVPAPRLPRLVRALCTSHPFHHIRSFRPGPGVYTSSEPHCGYPIEIRMHIEADK